MATTVQEKTAPQAIRTRSTSSKKKGSPQQGSPRTFKLAIDTSIQSEPNSPLSPSSPLHSPNLSRLPRAFTPERARKSYKRSSILRKLSQRTMPEEIVNQRRRLNLGTKESEGGEEGNPKDAEGGAAAPPPEEKEPADPPSTSEMSKSHPKKTKSRRNKSTDADGEDTITKRKRFQKNHSERNIFEKRDAIFDKHTPPTTKRSPKEAGGEEKGEKGERGERQWKEKREKKDEVERGTSFKLRKSRKNEVFWKKVNDEEAVGDEFSKKRGKKSQNFDDTWKKIRNMTNSCEEKNKEEKIAEKVEENWDTEEMDFFTFLRLEEEDLKKVPTPELPPLREKDPAVKKREKKKEKAKKEEDLQYTMDFEPDKVPLFELAEETKQALQNLWKDFLSKKTNTAFGEESAMTTFYQIFSELFLNTDAGKRLFKGSIAKLGPSLVKYLISIMGALDHPSSSPLGSSPKETIEPKPPRDPKEPTKAIPPEESYVDVLATTRRRKETLPKVVSCETFRDIAIQHRIYGAVNEDYLDFGQAFCETMERMEIDFFYKEEAEGKSVWMYIFEVFGNFIMDFGKKIEEKKTSGHVHIAWRRDGNWKKCFLVLSLDTLYIYNKEEKSKLLLHIKLSNILNIDKLNKFDHNYVPSDHGFELNLSYHRKPTIWICTTENFAKNWMKELKWRMVALDGLEA